LYEKSILYRQDVAESRRGLALVYLETDQLTEALRQFERAYEDEPSLALRVLDDRILAGSRLGYAMEVAKRAAERQSSARAWLAVAVLRQASGDREGARFAISEASRFGLHHRVVDSFYEATGR
jgi:tetratricopeptide (TPR) repeat protein